MDLISVCVFLCVCVCVWVGVHLQEVHSGIKYTYKMTLWEYPQNGEGHYRGEGVVGVMYHH